MHRADRLRGLFAAGISDSFGMALGWTVVVLVATDRGGMAEAALYNAAMLVGVVLSAPTCGWLTRRLAGRSLLQLSATTEMLLRVAVLVGLAVGVPTWLNAAVIVMMNVAGWVSFAGMRAEVTVVDTSPRSITRFAVCIAGVEAGGTALAALLPSPGSGSMGGWLIAAVWLLYPGSLLPTLLAARRARVAVPGRTRPDSPMSRPTRVRRPVTARRSTVSVLAAGGGVMLVAGGPTLLAVPITEQLYGGVWVAGAATAFSLGTLLSSRAVTVIARSGLPVMLRWPLWGIGMLAGWVVAPLFAPLVVVAQFVAGLSMAAFEGDMDARVAADADPGTVTRDLAYAASVRALGGAVCVRALPVMVAATAVGALAAGAAVILAAAAVLTWFVLSARSLRLRRVASV